MTVKKTVAPVASTKVEAPKAAEKKAAPTAAIKTETKTVVKEAEKAPAAKKETVVKEAEKAAAKKEVVVKEAEKAPAAKKETDVKKAEKAAAKKETTKNAELKSEISVQYGGKSYSQQELLKIAKDVWKYDLKQKASDLTSVELYVKPEENMVYYVMNKETTGSFYI